MGWTLLELQAETGIEKRTIHTILREDLQLRKIASLTAFIEVENGHDMQNVIYYFF